MQSEQNPDQDLDLQVDSQSQRSIVQIDLTPEFQQNLHDLAKRYRSIRFDIQVVIQELQMGNFVGDRLAGIGEGYVVLKTRVKNRDIQKGKSASYRTRPRRYTRRGYKSKFTQSFATGKFRAKNSTFLDVGGC